MIYIAVKVLVSAAIVALASELSRRSSFLGALLASLPLVSVLAMIWLYVDTRDSAQVAEFSRAVFWLVLPSLVLFVLLPALLARGVGFYVSLAASLAATVVAYLIVVASLRAFGLRG